jgi:membrane associated rhomboid family serine protease
VDDRFLLLYVVALGCAVGLGVLVHRKSVSMRRHGYQLSAIGGAAVLGILREDVGVEIAWPVFAAWAAVAIAPPLLVQSAQGAASMRRYGSAARLVAVASGLLLLPAHLRRQMRLYAALDAADRGDEARCRSLIAQMIRAEGETPHRETLDLERIFPAAAARRWGEVLAAVDESARRTPLVIAADAVASAETGRFARAIEAERQLAAVLWPGAHSLARVRRILLSAAGRVSFLEEALRTGMPVVTGSPGAAQLALARAFEASGDAEGAIPLYREAAALARGTLRRDAEEGRARCERGELRLAEVAEPEAAALHELERLCRAEKPDTSHGPLHRRAPATLGISAATTAVSAAVLLFLGDDMLSLAAAGAVGAPLVQGDGEWWRLGSSMLLHGGFAHLLLNVASILVVGFPYEQLMGPVRTTIVYVASGFVAAAASVWLNETAMGVGASGAAMGLFGALAVLLLARRGMFDPHERQQWLVSCALVLVANAGIGIIERDAIDNAAHGGGLVAGAVLGWLLLPPSVEYEAKRGARRMIAASLVTLVAVCAGAALGDVRHWRHESEIRRAGVRIKVPAWMQVEDDDLLGGIGHRKPVPFAVQFGVRGAVEPDAAALAERVFGDEIGPLAPDRWEPGDPVTRTDGDVRFEERLYRPLQERDMNLPLRVIVCEREGAFALAILAGDEESRDAFRRILDRLSHTIIPLAPRSDQ